MPFHQTRAATATTITKDKSMPCPVNGSCSAGPAQAEVVFIIERFECSTKLTCLGIAHGMQLNQFPFAELNRLVNACLYTKNGKYVTCSLP